MEKKKIDWRVETKEPVYKLGETVDLVGYFKSSVNYAEKWYILASLSTDDPMFRRGTTRQLLKLDPYEEKENVVLQKFVVSESYPSGEYKYTVGLEYERKVVDTKEVTFSIEGTPVFFEITTTLSSDKEGRKKTKAFLLDDKEVFLRIDSDVSPLTIMGVCVYPSGTENGLKFTNNKTSIKIEDIGKYLFKLKVRSDGYRTIRKHVSFSVVTHHPEFRSFKGKSKQ